MNNKRCVWAVETDGMNFEVNNDDVKDEQFPECWMKEILKQLIWSTETQNVEEKN